MTELREDFDSLEDGALLTLYPRSNNPLHKRPIKAVYQSGYFYCDGSSPLDGPDYHLGDVFTYNEGFIAQEPHP